MSEVEVKLANAKAIEIYARLMFSKGLKARAESMLAQAGKIRMQVEMAAMEATYAKAA